MQNTDDRLILTAEVTKKKMAKRTKIYFNKFARYFGFQHKSSSGAERKKNMKHKKIVTSKSLNMKMRNNFKFQTFFNGLKK